MIAVNFKKDWKMHKPILVSFFAIALVLFIIVTGSYLLLRFVDLSEQPKLIVNSIWLLVVSFVTLISSVLPFVLIYKVLKSDLGKSNVHYTIFTPQSIGSWFIPKLIYVFIVQGLFSLINLGYAYYLIDISNKVAPEQAQETFKLWENILAFFTSTFTIGGFGLIALSMALYYSFRKKGLSWFLIVVLIVGYLTIQAIYQITISVQQGNGVEISHTANLLMSYGIDVGVGLITLSLALFLFNKKIEY